MWPIWISIFAVAGTFSNFLFTQWATGRRDIAKWRREELQKLTATILELSTSRQGELNEAWEAYESHYQREFDRDTESLKKPNYVAQMSLVVEQIRLLNPEVAEKAAAIRDAHQSAEWRYQTSEEADPMSEIEMRAADGLKELHSELIDFFQLATGLQKRRQKAIGAPASKEALEA
jgi:hypothetical protein